MTELYAIPEISYIMWGIDAAGIPDPTSDVEPTVTCDKHFWNTQNFSDNNKNGLIRIYEIGGGRDAFCVKNGRFDSTFTIDANLTNDSEPLALILGQVTSNTAVATNSLPVFSVEVGYKDYTGSLKRIKFHGCKVDNAKFTQSKSADPIKVSLSIVAQRYWSGDTLQATSSAADCPFLGYEGKLSFNGANMVGIQDMNFEINNKLKKIEDSRSRFYSELKEGQREYNFSGSIYYTSSNSATSVQIENAFLGGSSPVNSSTPSANTIVLTFETSSLSKVTITPAASSYYVEDCSKPIDIGGDVSVLKFGGYTKSLTSIVCVN